MLWLTFLAAFSLRVHMQCSEVNVSCSGMCIQAPKYSGDSQSHCAAFWHDLFFGNDFTDLLLLWHFMLVFMDSID